MTVAYKYNQVETDNAVIAAFITGNGAANDTLAYAFMEITSTQSSYMVATIFGYDMTGTADSIHIMLFLPRSYYLIMVLLLLKSVLTIDDIGFTYPTSGNASPVGAIFAQDIADNHNGLDLEVTLEWD